MYVIVLWMNGFVLLENSKYWVRKIYKLAGILTQNFNRPQENKLDTIHTHVHQSKTLQTFLEKLKFQIYMLFVTSDIISFPVILWSHYN